MTNVEGKSLIVRGVMEFLHTVDAFKESGWHLDRVSMYHDESEVPVPHFLLQLSRSVQD